MDTITSFVRRLGARPMIEAPEGYEVKLFRYEDGACGAVATCPDKPPLVIRDFSVERPEWDVLDV